MLKEAVEKSRQRRPRHSYAPMARFIRAIISLEKIFSIDPDYPKALTRAG